MYIIYRESFFMSLTSYILFIYELAFVLCFTLGGRGRQHQHNSDRMKWQNKNFKKKKTDQNKEMFVGSLYVCMGTTTAQRVIGANKLAPCADRNVLRSVCRSKPQLNGTEWLFGGIFATVSPIVWGRIARQLWLATRLTNENS